MSSHRHMYNPGGWCLEEEGVSQILPATKAVEQRSWAGEHACISPPGTPLL